MTELPDPFLLLIVVAVFSILPFVTIMATSFVKIAIILSLIRNALGVQQIPPNMVLYGLATILTFYVMAPVVTAGYEGFAAINLEEATLAEIVEGMSAAIDPFRAFLRKHTSETEIAFFIRTAGELWPLEMRDSIDQDNLLILIPAFTVSELTSAFQIGFLIYLPFIAIDLIISNILLAMGMMMVSPMTISLPFKLLLFVMLDGWQQLIHGLVLTYM